MVSLPGLWSSSWELETSLRSGPEYGGVSGLGYREYRGNIGVILGYWTPKNTQTLSLSDLPLQLLKHALWLVGLRHEGWHLRVGHVGYSRRSLCKVEPRPPKGSKN